MSHTIHIKEVVQLAFLSISGKNRSCDRRKKKKNSFPSQTGVFLIFFEKKYKQSFVFLIFFSNNFSLFNYFFIFFFFLLVLSLQILIIIHSLQLVNKSSLPSQQKTHTRTKCEEG